MAPRYTKWTVRGYQRAVRDEAGFATGHDDVVEITEPGGWQWHLVVTDGKVVDFRMVDTGVRSVGRDDLRRVPLADLARMAVAYHERVLAEFTDPDQPGMHLRDALELAEIEPGGVRLRGDTPKPEEFAEAWQSIPGKAVDGTPRREVLAERFGVTPWAIDKWARRARDQGLIPQATTGRGNKRRQQDGAADVDSE